MNTIKVVDADIDASLACDERQVQEHIRRATHGGVNDDGVLKGLARQDASRRDLFLNQPEELLPRGAGIAQQLGEGRWNKGRTRQSQAQRLGDDLARAGAAHKLAGPTGGAGSMLRLLKVLPGE